MKYLAGSIEKPTKTEHHKNAMLMNESHITTALQHTSIQTHYCGYILWFVDMYYIVHSPAHVYTDLSINFSIIFMSTSGEK